MSEKKKYIIIMIILLIISFLFFIPFGFGINDLDIGNNQRGIIFLLSGIIGFVMFFIWGITYALKIDKINAVEDKTRIINSITNGTGKREFVSKENKTIYFKGDFFIYNGKSYSVKDFSFKYTLMTEFTFKTSHYDLYLSIYQGDEDDFSIHILLDKDVIDELKHNNVKIDNEEDLYYLINNEKETVNKMITVASMDGRGAINRYFPLSFVKNKEEKKAQIKNGILSIIISLIGLAFFIGITFLFAFFETENGMNLLEKIGFPYILVFCFLLLFILCAFVKASKVHIFAKLCMILFVPLFLLASYFLNERMNSLFYLISGLIFFFCGFYNFEEKKFEFNKNPKRSFYLSMFLFLLNISSVFNLSYEDDSLVALISAILGAIIMVIMIPFIIKKYKNKVNMQKAQKITLVIVITLGIFLGGFLSGAYAIFEINYIFDTSTPIIYNCQIEELEYDGESNYYAIVVIEEKEINLSLSTEEYYSYEIGDYIEVSCYQGALGFKYYIGE